MTASNPKAPPYLVSSSTMGGGGSVGGFIPAPPPGEGGQLFGLATVWQGEGTFTFPTENVRVGDITRFDLSPDDTIEFIYVEESDYLEEESEFYWRIRTANLQAPTALAAMDTLLNAYGVATNAFVLWRGTRYTPHQSTIGNNGQPFQFWYPERPPSPTVSGALSGSETDLPGGPVWAVQSGGTITFNTSSGFFNLIISNVDDAFLRIQFRGLGEEDGRHCYLRMEASVTTVGSGRFEVLLAPGDQQFRWSQSDNEFGGTFVPIDGNRNIINGTARPDGYSPLTSSVTLEFFGLSSNYQECRINGAIYATTAGPSDGNIWYPTFGVSVPEGPVGTAVLTVRDIRFAAYD